MWAILLLSASIVPDGATLHIKIDPAVSRLIMPYVQCVVANDYELPPGGVRAAFAACRADRKRVVTQSRDAGSRVRIKAALADFETQYLQLKLASIDRRE